MMRSFSVMSMWPILSIFSQAFAISFNQPKFCPNAAWNSTGIILADYSTVGIRPTGIFVNTNNTIYVANKQSNLIQVWFEGTNASTTIYILTTGAPNSLFVTMNDDIYVDNDNNGVDIWTLTATNSNSTLFVGGKCTDIFINSNNSLYCSFSNNHQVIKRSLNSSDYQTAVVAGTVCSGYLHNSLYYPNGIFVDLNFNLYVADSGNNRIQLFPLGQSNPTTVAGYGAPQTISLYYPIDVVLDADGSLFIVDSDNYRIVALGGSFGFRCIIGCSGGGSGLYQLNSPYNMAFDSYGNIFVADTWNNRILQFLLVSNSCNTTIALEQTSLTPIDIETDTTTTSSMSITATNVSPVSNQQTISYNQPKFCALVSWDPNAITFADQTMVGYYPYDLFIDTNNTVYTVASNHIQVWFAGNVNQMSLNSGVVSGSYSMFVTSSGDIYADNLNFDSQVDKWSINATSSTPVMFITQACTGLFVDINNTLYCSLAVLHQIVAKSLDVVRDTSRIIAGTGCPTSSSNGFSSPHGIFVDINFDLYVADSGNNRIQLFQSGQSTAKTIVGNGAPGTIALAFPTGVVLDADGYLFIVDRGNQRIVGSGPAGFRCVVGCLGTLGSASNQLYNPYTMAFDSYGNIFVTDTWNDRIQKFIRPTNSCIISYNQPTICPSASWNPFAITFANVSSIGSYSVNIFVDTANTVYVITQSLNLVQVWFGGSTMPTRNLTGHCADVCGVFVTVNGDIYVYNDQNNSVVKWALNTTNSSSVMNVSAACFSLFVDINNTLYCSIYTQHKVVKTFLDNNNSNLLVTAAGTGVSSPAPDSLNYPHGIFVNTNLDLYVADCNNNRIQLFHSGQLNATTVAGNGYSGAITLSCPSDIILDADNYLFIVDRNNQRIIGSGPNGFRCVAGCSNSSGSGSNQLYNPLSLAFDNFGNLFVADTLNDRIQLYLLDTNSCDATIDVGQTTVDLPTTLQTTVDLPTTSNTTEQTSIHTSSQSSLWSSSVAITKTTTASLFVPSNQSCLSPIIILIPSTTSLSSPLQFRRDQYFYFSSYLQLNCNSSLATNTRWSINNCTANCSFPIQLGSMIVTTTNELFIPAKTLPYGIYELKLIVSMNAATHLTSSASAYVKITPSGITANLVQYGTSMITRGHQQDLLLDPGTFSVDPDVTIFNASNWNYNYYCRIYGLYEFPNNLGVYLTIDDPMIDSRNPSCLSNRSAWQFGGKPGSPRSSMTILANSLASNQTYQFMVYMQNRINSSVQATGYLLVQVDDTQPQLVVIACVISTLCALNMEYQFVNPTTQVALFSVCIGTCTSINNVTWNVYSGVMNSSSNMVQWTPFSPMNQYQNIWFFGSSTANFTATDDLFLSYPSIEYWRFEVVYSFPSERTSSALNFIINQPPQNGSCSITPLNGTTSTVFTISCPNWQDQDGIQDYSIYTWTTDQPQLLMIAFTFISTIEIRLPAAVDNTSLVNLIVYIRDTLGCITQYNLTSVIVVPDTAGINDFMNSLQTSTSAANPMVRILTGGNQNVIGQVITTLSQVFNKMNTDSLNNAISNGVPATSISISSLGSQSSQSASIPMNTSALVEYNQQLNSQAQIRDYLMLFTTNLIIGTSNSIILQASSLAQLTQATNQLTRATALLASNKCQQLAVALYAMANQISYEDVQAAVTQLTQCTSNVISAINGPLQQRTSVLDLDFSRANTFPEDYDTDLESEWSNLSMISTSTLMNISSSMKQLDLFADGNDFSFETIQKNRNLYYQKQAANQIAAEVAQTLTLITAALNIQLNLKQNMTANSSSVLMSLEKASLGSLSNRVIDQIENGYIRIPSNFNSNAMGNKTISLRSVVQPLASAEQSSSQSSTNLSRSISLTILDQNAVEISIETNLTNPIELLIPRDRSYVVPSMNLQNVTSVNATPHHQLFNLQYIDTTSSLPISVHFEIQPLNTSLAYLFIYKFDTSPLLNSTVNQIDGWTLFCPSSLINASSYTYLINNQKTVGHQSIVFGLRELNLTEMINVCPNATMATPPITNDRFHFTSDYKLRIYTSGCYYLDANNDWQSAGLVVGPLTTPYSTQCYATHLTTFASGFTVFPAPINWNYVFANADFVKNRTIYLSVITVSILYLVLIIYARYKDGKDAEKLGVIPLPDNHRSDQYFYQIIVFTGRRKGAGTDSRVHFILSGEDDTTQVRTFACSSRSILQSAAIDAFVMAVPKSLGLLRYIRLWHDQTGGGASASWFLKYIIVRDLQTMEKWHFICQRWFAVEKDDGKIERVLFVANELEKQDVSYVLSKGAYHKLSADHLWFSIFSRPIADKFTRVQRCTCCFVLLFISMFLSIMYYDLSTEAQANNSTAGLSVGPFHIGVQEIAIGVIVELFSLIPSIFLVELFRRLRPRPSSHILYSIKLSSPEQLSIDEDSKKKKRLGLTFPWWCLFVAYGLCLISIAVSILFIIARGIEFGDLKTQKWLTSLVSSFFSSIFLIQPIKVLSLAIFFAWITRTNDDQEAGQHLAMENPEFWNTDAHQEVGLEQSLFTYRPPVRYNRLNEGELDYARYQRLKEKRMWSIVGESFIYVGFLVILYMITYSNHDRNTFLQVNHLRKYFLNTRQSDNDYATISTIDEYWSWLEGSFVSNLRAQPWYNGAPPRNLNGFINDKSNRMIGWATIRQLRSRSILCPNQRINRYCMGNEEETRSFEIGWMNETTQILNTSIDQAFIYQTSEQLGTYSSVGNYGSYSGNGYVYQCRGRLEDVRSNLSKLHQLGWIDNRTQAVIIQWNLYNPNSQLFTSITLLAEFLSTGGIETESQFEPVNFYSSFLSIFQWICLIIYIGFILYFVFHQIKSFIHSKFAYFQQVWSYIELAIIICSWTSVGIYVWRYREASRIATLFEKTNGYVYINLQLVVYISNILTYFLGFCCFFGTIQFIHLCRVSSRVSLFTDTLKHAVKDLLGFGLMFSIVFMAFLALFYLLFISKMSRCSSLFNTTKMLFEMMFTKFNTGELISTSPFLGPFCFSIFMIIVVFICMSMFVSIVINSFRCVRARVHHDEEIVSFMWNRFQCWIGWKQLERYEGHGAPQYVDPMTSLSMRIDELLDALNRLYMSQRTGRIY